MKLVFIVGKKRSGKDTAVKQLSATFTTHHYKLADPIKRALDYGYVNTGAHWLTNIFLGYSDWDGEGFDREIGLPLNNKDAAKILTKAVSFLRTQKGLIPSDGKIIFDDETVENIITNLLLNNKEAWSIRRFMQTLGTDIVVNKLDRMFWMKLFANEYMENYEDEQLDFLIVPDTRQDHELSFARAMGATVVHVVRDSGDTQVDTHITEKGLPISPDDIVITNNGTLEEFKTHIQQVFEKL